MPGEDISTVTKRRRIPVSDYRPKVMGSAGGGMMAMAAFKHSAWLDNHRQWQEYQEAARRHRRNTNFRHTLLPDPLPIPNTPYLGGTPRSTRLRRIQRRSNVPVEPKEGDSYISGETVYVYNGEKWQLQENVTVANPGIFGIIGAEKLKPANLGRLEPIPKVEPPIEEIKVGSMIDEMLKDSGK